MKESRIKKWVGAAVASLFCVGMASAAIVTNDYAADDTWMCPAGVTEITVSLWGGGGAGGGVSTSGTSEGGGGGAGGQYAESLLTVVPYQTYAITVGAGGVGGEMIDGTPGGDTVFGANLVVAKGGAGGGVASGGTSTGGLGSALDGIGDTVVAGGDGGNGNGAGSGAGGQGGNSGGAGGAAIITPPSSAGNPGAAPGGGGSGSAKGGGTNTSFFGGAGAVGLARVVYTEVPAIQTNAPYTMCLDLAGDGTATFAEMIDPSIVQPGVSGNELRVLSVQQSGTGSRPGPDEGNVTVLTDRCSYEALPDVCFNCQQDQFWYEIGEFPAGGPYVTPLARGWNRVVAQYTNTPPVANDDSEVTDEDTEVCGNVLDNDYDCADDLTATVLTLPANGTLTDALGSPLAQFDVIPDGDFCYTPNANWCGEDSFEYQVCDNPVPATVPCPCNQACDNGLVTITVNPVNDDPEYTGTTSTVVLEDDCVTMDLLADCIDLDDLTGCDCNGVDDTDPTVLSIEITAQPTLGTLTDNQDGTYTYCPNPDSECADTFEFTVADDCGAVAGPYTMDLTVDPENDCPALVGPVTSLDATFLTSGWTGTQSVQWSEEEILSNFYDPDTVAELCGSDTMYYVVDSNPDRNGSWAGVNAAINMADGSLEVSADPDISNPVLNPVCMGERNTVEIYLLVYDQRQFEQEFIDKGQVCPNKGEMLIRINIENDTWENSDLECPQDGYLFSTLEDTPLTILNQQILAPIAAANPDGICNEQIWIDFWQNSLNWTETEFGGTASLDGSTVLYTPPENFPGQCGTGIDTFPIWIASDNGDLIECTVQVEVTAVNDPVTVVDDVVETCEDTIVPISMADLLANDTDPDWGDEGLVAFEGLGTPEFTVSDPGTLLPDEIGGYAMTPFDVAAQEAAFSPYIGVTTDYVPGGICGDQLGIAGREPAYREPSSPEDVDVLAMADWGLDNWGTGYDGPVYFYDYSDPMEGETVQDEEIVMDLPVGTRAFSFYVQTYDSTEETTNLIVYAYDNLGGVYSETLIVQGTEEGNGARGVAVSTTDPNRYLTRVVVYGSTYSEGIAVADFAISMGGYAYVFNVGGMYGFGTAPQHGELIVDGYADSGAPSGFIITSLQYRPYEHFYGEDTFSYSFISFNPDGSPNIPNSGMVTVQVHPVSDLAPEANDDEFSAVEDTPLGITLAELLANDNDGGDSELGPEAPMTPENLCLEAFDFTSAEGGLVEFIDGVFTYTPPANFFGEDSFTYTITDQSEDCEGISECNDGNAVEAFSTATVGICVAPVNDPAIAIRDAYYGTRNETIMGNVLDNDFDQEVYDGQGTWEVELADAQDLNGGTLDLNPDGSFVYTPSVFGYGDAAFSYQVIDHGQESVCGDSPDNTSAPTLVTIALTYENICPTANGVAAATLEDQPVTIALSGQDIGGSDAGIAGVVIGVAPAHGTLTLANGGVGATVDALYTPDPNWNGVDTFTFAVTDIGGCTSPYVTATVTVTGDNDAPEAYDQSVVTDRNVPINITVAGYDMDGDALSYTIVDQPVHGVLQRLNGNTWTYTPALIYTGSDMFTFRADDGELSSGIATVDITILPTLYVEGDWEGDGAANPIVFINSLPPNGLWRGLTTAGTIQEVNWGSVDMIPVPGDYNGDGVLDPAVFNPVTMEWLVKMPGGNQLSRFFNYPGAVPVPADYDGDGVTDMAVYDKGVWYIQGSTDGFITVTWGWGAAQPVPADYDGDGMADITVYDPATANWYILVSSSMGLWVGNWGFPGVIPVPADYDGDGHADIAVYSPQMAMWFISGSTVGYQQFNWGFGGVVPVPADYDADGLADIAVYSASLGSWYINQTTDGYRQDALGGPGAKPVTSMPGLWSLLP